MKNCYALFYVILVLFTCPSLLVSQDDENVLTLDTIFNSDTFKLETP